LIAINTYRILFLITGFFVCICSQAQFTVPKTDSWQSVKEKKQGSISALWYDIEPFIYRDGKGNVIGVEYELMEGLKGYLKNKYNIDLTINWVDAGSFESIYPYIKQSKEKALFGLSFYSITDERKQDVKFSPPYMPDLNILVTNNNLPVYATGGDFIKDLSKMKGFTMKKTTMEEDIQKLKRQYYPALEISNQVDDYEVLKQIATYQNAFGYVPLSIYVIALQRGIKIKRQRVLATRREGFAAIYTKASDWDEPINEYFSSSECKFLVSGLIRKYLGSEVADIILSVSASDTAAGKPTDIELLTKEREIVTQRLIDTALDAERSKTQRNIFLIAGAMVLIIAAISYGRFRTKHRLNKKLQQQNELILAQKTEIENINRRLQQKLVLSQLNPHLIFNSLTAIQHFVMMEDKKTANKYLAQLAKFIRQILRNADEPMINIEDEKTMIEQYLALEKERFEQKFDYKVTATHEAAAKNIPSMLVFPFVEQALYERVLKINANGNKPLLCVDFISVDEAVAVKIKHDKVSVVNANDIAVSKSAKLAEEQIDLINKNQTEKITIEEKYHGNYHERIITIPASIIL
jgi:ABC-type amino acid transport substrate-binding protein